MQGNQPITSAVYGNRAAGKKRRKPSAQKERRQPVTSVGNLLGPQASRELYEALGMKHPADRPKRKRGQR